MQETLKRPKRILISVSDKEGLEKLARVWARDNVEMVASGGTARHLRDLGYEVSEVSTYSKNPEAFGGRMKTLSFPIFSGILYNRDSDRDQQELQTLHLHEIDGVVCNFYPFEKALSKKEFQVNDSTLPDLVENIDIGGPAMVRAAAKNFFHTFVLTDPGQYSLYLEEYEKNDSQIPKGLSLALAKDAFQLCSHYDQMIFESLYHYTSDRFAVKERFDFMPRVSHPTQLRYGENPHQKASFFPFQKGPFEKYVGLSHMSQLQGKELSYNNFLDVDAALKSLAANFQMLEVSPGNSAQACVIVKHQNPCGMCTSIKGEADGLVAAAWSCDPVSSFGGIVATSFEFDLAQAEFLSEHFVEVVIAPNFSKEAVDVLARKKNLRLLKFDFKGYLESYPKQEIKSVAGGVLIQETDLYPDQEFKQVTKKSCEHSDELCRFGVASARALKSNAISLVTEDPQRPGLCKLVGAGMGNPNRLVSFEQAVQKARDNGVSDFDGVLLVSDAFFPFDDIVKKAADVGIKSFIQPGGSIKDDQVIATCDQLGLSMVFTGRRHFSH